jgi:hypothetical protein
MITDKVKAMCGSFRGQPLVATNQCCHCGEVDDPESARRWPEDEDGDRICYECAERETQKSPGSR